VLVAPERVAEKGMNPLLPGDGAKTDIATLPKEV
jgi:hypothetical protein